ncbi:MAG: DUF1684 domain-containing protein [Betaproteobacteria bacterium]
MRAGTVIAAGALALVAAACGKNEPRPEAYRQEVEQFRAKHEADYRKEYVSLAGLAFLEPGENRAGSAEGNAVRLPASTPAEIGTFVLNGSDVRFEPKPGAGVTLKGQPVTSPIALRNDGGKEPPDELTIGSVAIWVHTSGDRRAIRIRDEQGEVARNFAGFTWFPIDPKYRVVGRFIREPEAREVKVPMITGDFATYKTEGLVEFTLDGQTIRMRPMTTRPNRFFFIFTDGTTGHETYHAARFLYADLKPDGTTVLDFNEAYNPPCSFNPFTTCPLPPPENRMKVRVLAGEKDYVGRHAEFAPQ